MRLEPLEVKELVSRYFPHTVGRYPWQPGEWQTLTDGLNRIGLDEVQVVAILSGQRAKRDRASIATILDQAKVAQFGENTGSSPSGKPRPWGWIDTARQSMRLRADMADVDVVRQYWAHTRDAGRKVNGAQFCAMYSRQCANDLCNAGLAYPDAMSEAAQMFAVEEWETATVRYNRLALAGGAA